MSMPYRSLEFLLHFRSLISDAKYQFQNLQKFITVALLSDF